MGGGLPTSQTTGSDKYQCPDLVADGEVESVLVRAEVRRGIVATQRIGDASGRGRVQQQWPPPTGLAVDASEVVHRPPS